MTPKAVLAPDRMMPAVRRRHREQVNRLGIDPAGRYGAARLPERDNSRCRQAPQRTLIMAENIVPHFHNAPGVPVIEIGAKEFQCVGATPPFDHPHVFLDMGDANEIICPYCSTLYRHDASLDSHSARPPECALESAA
jgi:uncharacterized Zn-finger protein